MSKVIADKIGSTIYARINALKITEIERHRALDALYEAQMFVDAFARVAKKIEQLRGRLFLKPSLKH